MATIAEPSIDPEIALQIPYPFARTNGVISARIDDEVVDVLHREDSCTTLTVAELRRHFALPVRLHPVSSERFDTLLEQAYAGNADDPLVMINEEELDTDLRQMASNLPKVADLLDDEQGAPVISFINTLLTRALREGASDVHFEIFANRSVTRFRIDGVLLDICEPERTLHGAIISRLKVMAELDIAEKRLPQDGRFSLRLGGRPVDARIATMPTVHGERVALRLLEKGESSFNLQSLGMDEPMRTGLLSLVKKPHGVLLVTGPTGSGKSTTIYALLNAIDRRNVNIMTIEDPVEFDIEGVNQTQAHAKIDMTFARGLRAILRHDPDIVMIGEIRDSETAHIAVQASLTGHLVLATLHTNDAPGAVTRLVDMGVEPYLLASSLLGVLGQRLVRTLCPLCHQEIPADEMAQALMRRTIETINTAVGCDGCRSTGYRGRSGVFELLVADEKVSGMIHSQTPESQLRSYLRNEVGMKTLAEDGYDRVASGSTSLEEVLRVTERTL